MRPGAVAVALAIGSLAGEARAQAPDPAFVEARARFEEAVRAVQAGRPADAIGLFERSYATRPAPVVAMNLASCLRGLGRFAEARRWYLRFLETATPEDLARYEPTVRAHLDEVTGRLALVTADATTPPGARVLLDGSPLAAGGRHVDPGTHRVEASAPGFLPGAMDLAARTSEVLRLSTRLTPVPVAEPVTQRWWFWTGLAVVVVGLTTAVLAPTLADYGSAP